MHRRARIEGRSSFSRVGRLAIAVLMVLSLTLSFLGTPADAADTLKTYQITSFAQHDTNSDGRPDQAEIHCRCFTKDDRIIVDDPVGDMKPADTVDQGSDMTNDLWLFDVGNRGSFQIAVQFNDGNNQLTADVYQDQDADGQVATGTVSGHTAVTEPGHPVIHMRSLDGFWQRDGRIALNLDITVDGRVQATFNGEKFIEYMSNDGRPDVVIRVRGPHDDDARSYDWRNVETPVPSSSAIYRSTLMVRQKGEEPPIAPVFPWYFLGPNVNFVKPYGQSFPPIQVNWNTGKIVSFSEIIASRASGDNWFTYSNYGIRPGKLNNPDFESPFAFYNLADDDSGQPDMQVRIERAIPDDRFVDPNWRGRPYQQIRYSWEQRPGQNWSFKLGLLGQKPIDSTVNFPDFSLKTVPYDQLPTWVTTNNWDVATFVAVERDSYSSTEGIYEWDTAGALRDDYYSGATDVAPRPPVPLILGERGEYAPHLDAQPWLYLSPVDGRLHLIGAESGLYRQDKTHNVEYQNLAGGAHIDAWLGYDGDQLARQLYQLPNGLIFAANRTVSLLDANIAQETFRTLPPTNHAEWTEISQHLSTIRPINAGDLQTMYSQFPGKQTIIKNATMSNLRFTDTGYRFILDLQPGFDLGGLAVSGVTNPGRYVITYDTKAKRYSAEPARDANAEISPAGAPDQTEARRPTLASFQVENQGSIDLTEMPVVITARSENRAPIVVQEQAVPLLAGEPVDVKGSWQPPRTGQWTVTATVYLPDGKAVKRSETVTVKKADEPPWQEVVRGAWPHTSAPLYLSLLLGLVSIPIACGVLLIRKER